MSDLGVAPLLRRVLVLYTGGTIGMMKGPRGYEPVVDFLGRFVASSPQLHDPKGPFVDDLPYLLPATRPGLRVGYRIVEYTPLLDSSNIGLADWRRIATDIAAAYDDHDAFVVLHGTDTMAFTASALSFMFEHLGKTVIITGSQIPVSEARNDGIDNLLGALTIAGHYDIPEVGLYFANRLMRGNRCVKLDAAALDAFHSGNFPPLVEVGISIKVAWSSMIIPPDSARFTLQTELEPNVAALRLFPGMSKSLIDNVTRPPLRGLVLQTYGTGNAPDRDQDFLDALAAATARGVVIVNCTQCFRGMVEAHYAAGQKLAQAGVVSGADMTVEAALTKLSYLFGRGDDVEAVKAAIGEDLRGELSLPPGRPRFSFRDRSFIKTVAAALGDRGSGVATALSPVLMCAAAGIGDLGQLRQLVDDGAEIDSGDYDGRTPLHVAASAGHVKIVQYLLALGASPSPRDRWGRTPIDEARAKGQDAVVRLLESVGSS